MPPEGVSGSSQPAFPRLGRVLKKAAVILIFLPLLGGLLYVLHFEVVRPHPGLDFLGFYAAGKVLREGKASALYRPGLNQRIEDELVPHSDPHPFVHPPFEAWLFEQLAAFSFPRAYMVWAAINLAALFLIFYLIRFAGPPLDGDSGIVWLLVCLPPVLWTLMLGQDSLFVALAFLLSYLSLKRRREFLAGLALGIGLFRLEIVLPFAFIFLLRRRWKFLGGLSVAGAGATVASAAVVGWHGLFTYGATLVGFGHTAGGGQGLSRVTEMYASMPTLNGLLVLIFANLLSSRAIFLLGFLAALAILSWSAWPLRSISDPSGAAFNLEFSFAVIASLLSSYYMFAHELAPMIVVAFLILGYESAARRKGFLHDRAGTMLLLLLVPLPVLGAIFGFRDFGGLSLVLLGLMVWLSQEIGELPKAATPR